jgi:hypothetical protein
VVAPEALRKDSAAQQNKRRAKDQPYGQSDPEGSTAEPPPEVDGGMNDHPEEGRGKK